MAASSTNSSKTGLQMGHHTLEKRMFLSVYSLFNEHWSKRSDFLTLVIFIVQILQLIGLVFNPILVPEFSSLFDPRFLFSFLSRLSTVHDFTYFLAGSAILSVILLTLLVFSSSVSKSGDVHSKLRRPLRVLMDLCPVLIIPFSLRFYSFLSCSSTKSDMFTYPFSTNNCWSPMGMVAKAASLLCLSFLFLFGYMHHCLFFDRNPLSKRLWARSHSKLHFLLLISQFIVPGVMVLLPSRVWLFRITYLLVSFTITFLFAWYIPFYFKFSCMKFSAVMGLWPGTAIGYLVFIVCNQYYKTTSEVQNFLIFIGFTILFSLVFSLISKFRYEYFAKSITRAEEVAVPVTSTFSIDLDALDSPPSTSNIQADPKKFIQNFKIPTSFLQADLCLKFLFPKPSKSPFKQLSLELVDKALENNQESTDLLLLRHLIELIVINNPLCTVSLSTTLSSMDVELNFSQKYFQYWLERNAEELRRARSTGDTSLDSNSYVNFQKSLIDLKDIHEDCLASIHQFWSILLAPNPDLSYLPAATSRIQKNRQSAESMFSKLLASHPHDRDLLVKYSSFLKEVAMDNEMATFYSEQADLLTNTSDKSSNYGSSSMGSRVSHGSGGKRKRRRLANLRTSLSKTTDDTRKQSSIELLSYSIVAALSIMIIIAGISFILMYSCGESTLNIMQQTLESAHFVFVANRAGCNLYTAVASLQGLFDASVISIGAQLREDAEHVNYHLRRVFSGDSGITVTSSFVCPRVNDAALDKPSNDLVINSLFLPSVVAQNLRSTNPIHYEAEILNLLQFVFRFSSSMAKFSQRILYQGVTEMDHFLVSSSSFIFLNNPTLSIAARRFWNVLVTASNEFFNLSKVMIGISLVITVLLTLALGFLLFARIFKKISHERNEVLNLFLYVPKFAIKSILDDSKFAFLHKKSKRNELQTFDSEAEDSETHELGQSPFQSKLSVFNTDSAESDVVDLEEENESPQMNRRRLVFYVLLVVIATLAVAGILVLFIIDFPIKDEFNAFSVIQKETSSLSLLESKTFTLVNSFISTGDPYFIHHYFDLTQSSSRYSALQSIYALVDVIPYSLFSTLTRGEKIRAEISHLNNVVLYLGILGHGLDLNNFPQISQFSYDFSTETESLFLSYQYSSLNFWYSDSESDKSLSSETQLQLSRHVVTSDYYMGLIDSINSDLQSFYSESFDHLRNSLKSNYSLLIFASICLFISCILIILTTAINHFLIVPHLSRSLRKSSFYCHLTVILLTLLLIGLIFTDYSTLNHIINASESSADVFMTVNQFNSALVKIWNHAQIFAIQGVPQCYFDLRDSFIDLEKLFNTINSLDIEFGIDPNSLKLSLNILHEELKSLENTINIVNSVAFSLHNLPLILAPELIDFTWDITSRHDYHLLIVSGLINSLYNNTEFDLNFRSKDSKKNLITFMLNSRNYYDTVSKISTQRIEYFTQFLTSNIEKLIDVEYEKTILYFYTALFLFFLIIGSVVLMGLYVYNQTHTIRESFTIQQTIKIEMTVKFTRQYIVALSILSLLLVAFFVVGFYFLLILQPRPLELTIAGSRLSLVSESLAVYYSMLAEPETSESRVLDLNKRLDDLISAHSNLIYIAQSGLLDASANRYSPMTTLLFNTQYNTNFTGDGNNGLDFLLNRFISMLQSIAKREISQLSFNSVETSSLHQMQGPLNSLCLDALDLYLAETTNQVTTFKTVVSAFLVVFIVVALAEYFFVFRNMLCRLQSEEDLSRDLIAMIPSSVTESSSVIRDYIASMED
ncbi:hypothetical protein RCL1_001697 [Eukaryota sp. TZLM3-RCL]